MKSLNFQLIRTVFYTFVSAILNTLGFYIFAVLSAKHHSGVKIKVN